MSKRTDYLDNIISGNQEANKSDRVKYLDNIIGSAEKKAAPASTKPTTTLEEERANERDKMLTPSVSRQNSAVAQGAFGGGRQTTYTPPTLGERLGKIVTGAAKSTGAGYVNNAGTAIRGEAERQKQQSAGEISAWQETIRAYQDVLSDPTSTQSERETATAVIADLNRRIDAYGKAYGTDGANERAANAVYGAADRLADSANADIERAQEGLGTVGKLLVGAGVAGTQMGLDALTAPPGATLVPLFFRASGGAAQQARRNGADFDTANTVGGLTGAVEVLTEKMFDGLAGIYGGGAADDLVARFISKHTSSPAFGRLLSYAASAAGESAEEVVAGLVEPAIESIYNKKSYGENFDPQELLESAIIGGLLGLVGGNTMYSNVLGADAAAIEAENEAAGVGKGATERALEMLTGRTTVRNAPAAAQNAQEGTQRVSRETMAPTQEAPQSGLQGAGTTTQDGGGAQAGTLARFYEERVARMTGENGGKAFVSQYDGAQDIAEYTADFLRYWNAGAAGKKLGTVQNSGALSEPQRFAAYSAGQNDAKNSLNAEMSAASSVKANVQSGISTDEMTARNTSAWSEQQRGTVDTLGRKLGVRVVVDDSIGGVANGYYDAKKNEIHIAADAENPALQVLRHEATHRMQQLSPKEYRAFRDYAVRMAGEDAVEAKMRAYSRGDVLLSEEEAMDEIAAETAEKLLTDETAISDFIRKNRTAAQKFYDALRSIVQKVKEALGADQTLAQAERLWKSAFEKADAQARTSSLQEGKSGDTMTPTQFSMKEDSENGRRKEEREDFKRRCNSDGYSVYEGKETVYGYRAIQGRSARENARQVLEEVKALGIDAHIIEGDLLWNEKGVSGIKKVREAVTAAGDGIFVSNSVSLPPRNVAGHEAFHLWSGTESRDAYIEVLEDNLIFNNDAFLEYQSRISDAYLGEEADLSEQKQVNKLFEELFAYISGDIHEGTNDEYLRPMLRDMDAVKASWNELVSKNSDGKKFSLKTDSEGRELSEQQQEYFKDSKVRDEDGNLLALYHQTETEFTVFDPRHPGAGARDDATPFGIFMKTSAKDIGLNGKRQMGLYANIKNPLYAESREALTAKLADLSEEYADIRKEIDSLNDTYRKKFEAAKKALIDFIQEWRKQNPDASGRALYDVPEFNAVYDAEDAVTEEWTAKADELSTKAKEVITAALQDAGYDGVILANDTGSFGRRTDAYIALYPEQVKNVTNAAPTDNADIRFSMKKSVDDYMADLEAAKKELAEIEAIDIFSFIRTEGFGNYAAFDKKRTSARQKVKRIEKRISELSAPRVESADPVDSKAFKLWFGDWSNGKGSKVVGADGRPMMVYHGTGTTIEEFLPEFTGKGTDQYGSGFYFTTSKSTADGYTTRTLNEKEKPGGMDNPNVIPAYLNIRHPLVVDAKETPNLYSVDVTPTMAARIISKMPDIMDPENSILGDYFDEFWESGPKRYMISKLAQEYDWTIGSLETDIFRYYPAEFRQAVKDVLGYDGVQVNFGSGEKHFIAWFPNQIKHATENSGAFSKKDNRIKYSLRDNSPEAVAAKQQEMIEWLRGQLRVSKGVTTKKGDVAKIARATAKAWDSSADVTERLQAMYDFMANGKDANGNELTWDDLWSEAKSVAGDMLSESMTRNDDLYREYADLRRTVRDTKLNVPKELDGDLDALGGYGEFRRGAGRALNLSRSEGTGIDVFFSELSDTYPEFFSEDATSNPADQLARIAEVMNDLKPVYENRFAGDEQAVNYLADELINSFYDARQEAPTFADKAALGKQEAVAKVKNAARDKLNAREAKLRSAYDERIAKMREMNRQKIDERMSKLREQRDKKIEAVKEKYKAKDAKGREKRSARELRGKIIRHAKKLSGELLRPTDKHHIPERLRKSVAAVLESINLESSGGKPTKRTAAWQNLKAQYERLLSDGEDIVIDADFLGADGLFETLAQMSDKPIADMSTEELSLVWRALRGVEGSIQSVNKAFALGKFKEISEASESLRAENRHKKDKRELANAVGDAAQTLVTLESITPETYFHQLGKAGDRIFRALRDAQDKQITLTKKAIDFTRSLLGEADISALEKETHEVTLGGERVKLTTAQIMELYVLSRREQAINHIVYGGGIHPDTFSDGGIYKETRAEPIRGITLEDIADAVSVLTKEQIALAEAMQDYLSTECAAWGNEASMTVYNYEKFGEAHYWPIRTSETETKKDVQTYQQVVPSIGNSGFAQATKKGANTSIRIGSIFDTYAKHVADMANYSAWLATSEDMRRVQNFRFMADGVQVGNVQGVLAKVHGARGGDYWMQLMTNIAAGVQNEKTLTGGLTGAYKAAAVGANIRVIIQQPTAIIRAASMIDGKYFANRMNPVKGWEKAKQYAPIAQWKDWGYFDISTGRKTKDLLFESDSKLEKTKNALMQGAALADSVSWGALWNACESETRAEHKELSVGSEAYYEAVAKRFTEIIDHTQVVDGVLQRSQIMRRPGELTKMITAFMGEPTKTANMLYSAVYDFRNATGESGRKEAKAKLGRTGGAVAASLIVNAIAQSLVDGLRDDDRDKKYWEKFASALKENANEAFNPFSYYAVAKDIKSIFQGYDVERMDVSSISDFVSSVKTMRRSLDGEGKMSIPNATVGLVAALARFYGIPLYNIKRDIESIVNTFANETGNYVMQYHMTTRLYNPRYDDNKSRIKDILFDAYQNDQGAYEIIYADIVKHDYFATETTTTEKAIVSAIESRMKAAQGVTKVEDMERRYYTPEQQKHYDTVMRDVTKSNVWKSASAEQRKALEKETHTYLAGSGDDAQRLTEKIAEGEKNGITESEYLLYMLALEITEKPNEDGKKDGNPTNDELEEAIRMLQGLSDKERSYLWSTKRDSDVNDPWK